MSMKIDTGNIGIIATASDKIRLLIIFLEPLRTNPAPQRGMSEQGYDDSVA